MINFVFPNSEKVGRNIALQGIHFSVYRILSQDNDRILVNIDGILFLDVVLSAEVDKSFPILQIDLFKGLLISFFQLINDMFQLLLRHWRKLHKTLINI